MTSTWGEKYFTEKESFQLYGSPTYVMDMLPESRLLIEFGPNAGIGLHLVRMLHNYLVLQSYRVWRRLFFTKLLIVVF